MLKLETHGGFSMMKPRLILAQLVMQEMFLSCTPHDARNVRIQNFGGSFLGASQCVKSLPWMTEPTKWWALSNLWDLILSWRLIWVDVSIHYQANPPMETVNLGSLSLCSCFPPLPVALFNGSCQGFIIKRWTPFFRILCMLEWRSELVAHGGAKASKLAGRWN
jgi:hypothetical protein